MSVELSIKNLLVRNSTQEFGRVSASNYIEWQAAIKIQSHIRQWLVMIHLQNQEKNRIEGRLVMKTEAMESARISVAQFDLFPHYRMYYHTVITKHIRKLAILLSKTVYYYNY